MRFVCCRRPSENDKGADGSGIRDIPPEDVFWCVSIEKVEDEDEDWEERNQSALSEKLDQLNIGMADHGGFMGQSSAFMLMRSALSFKETLLGKATPGSFDAHIRRPRFWQLEPVRPEWCH